MGNLEASEAALRDALALLTEEDSAGLRGRVFVSLADILRMQNRFDEAEQALLEARKHLWAARAVVPLTALSGMLGRLAGIRGDIPTARRHYQRSVSESQALGVPSIAAMNQLNWLNFEATRGDPQAA